MTATADPAPAMPTTTNQGGGTTKDRRTIERLLDRFPLSERDLLRALALFEDCQKDDPGSSGGDDDDFAAIFRQQRSAGVMSELSGIFQRTFESVFVASDCCYAADEDAGQNTERRDRFLEAVVSVLGRRGERFLMDAIFDQASATASSSNDDDEKNVARTDQIMGLVYRLAVASLPTTTPPAPAGGDKHAAATSSEGWAHALSREPTVSRRDWIDWLTRTDGRLHLTLPGLYRRALGLEDPGENGRYRQFCLPSPLPSSSSAAACDKEGETTPPFSPHEMLTLGAMGLGGEWHPLYDSDEHGLSFEAFQEKLLSYSGPTLIFIRTTKDGENGNEPSALGYVTRGVPWKESRKWYTNLDDTDSFLFRLSPRWSVYPIKAELMTPKSTHKWHQYLNTPYQSLNDPTPGLKPPLRGLAVGGVDADSPRLHLTDSLEKCRATSYDLVFDQGPLLSGGRDDEAGGTMDFDVDLLQIWAVGVDGDGFRRNLKAGRLNAAVREETRHRIAYVDKRQFVEDFTSGAYMNPLYDHREQTRGRTDFVDDGRRGYYVEGKRPSVAIARPNSNGGGGGGGGEEEE